MEFEIFPYLGAGELRFGMQPEEVLNIVGQPQIIRKNTLGELNYIYGSFEITFNGSEQSMVEVGFSPSTKVWYKDIDIFNEPQRYKLLLQEDGNPQEYVGFLILLKLGFTLVGFHDDDEYQRAVTIFARGRWDDIKSKMIPFYL